MGGSMTKNKIRDPAILLHDNALHSILIWVRFHHTLVDNIRYEQEQKRSIENIPFDLLAASKSSDDNNSEQDEEKACAST
tara:strand:+ start:1648 stop:1887 length:240 start_codon:yes stop_codon:yes gene_type:complete